MKDTTHRVNGGQAGPFVGSPQESPSKIRDMVSLAENNVTALHQAVDDLEQRLSTALQVVPPSTVGNATPQQSGSHLFERLQSHQLDLNGLLFRVNELTQRIEV